MSILNKLNFAQKIIFVAALVLFLVQSATAIINYYSLHDSTEESLQKAIGQIGVSVASNISNWLNAKLLITEGVANSIISVMGDDHAIRNVTQQGQDAGDFKNVYFGYESSGKFILDDKAVNDSLPASFDARNRPWYELAKKLGEKSFTPPYVDASVDKLVLSPVVPVKVDGQLLGVVGGDLNLSAITEIVNSVDFMGLGHAFLLNGEGVVLSHPQTQYNGKSYTEVFGASIVMDSKLQSVKIDKKRHLVAFITIDGLPNTDMRLAVVLDKTLAFAPIDKARNRTVTLGSIGLALTIGALLLLVKRLMRPVHSLTRAIRDISGGDGDLTQRIEIDSGDEIGVLSDNFNKFLDTIHCSMQEVNQAATELNDSIVSVRNTSNVSLEMSQEQLSLSGNVATALSELGLAAQDMTHNASNASSLAGNIQQQAQQGLVAINDNIGAMDTLSDCMTQSSEQIDKLSDETANIDNILEVIKGVSSQTNLLALNAAIEAARAGEAGRGFSVVADEVRQLAQRTQDSTQEIAGLITNLQQGADAAVETMRSSHSSSQTSVDMANDAGEKMRAIEQALVDIDNENNAVAQSTRQQEVLIGGIDEEMAQLNNIEQKRADCLQQTIEACDELQQQFARLDALVGQFKV